MHSVELFAHRACDYCLDAKKEILEAVKNIRERGVEIKFVVLDISESVNFSLAKEYLKRRAIKSNPQIIIPITVVDGKHIIVGYRKGLSDELVKIILPEE